MQLFIKAILTATLGLTAFAATATDVDALPERQRAAYCSGVLGQQSLLFLQLSAIHKRSGREKVANDARYNSDQLFFRAQVLALYGDDERIQTRAYQETGKAIQKAKDEKQNPVGSFYGLAQQCMQLYRSMQDMPEIRTFEGQVSAEARKGRLKSNE